MSEQSPQQTGDQEAGDQQTGHPAVDGVLESMAGLADLPVDEHVAVFETAHDTLRSALADAAQGG